MNKAIFIGLFVFVCLLSVYLIQKRNDPLGVFLQKTHSLTDNGQLDADIWEKLMSPEADPNVSDFMIKIANQYMGYFAEKLRENRGEDFLGIATNEPYQPELKAAWVYIIDASKVDFEALPLRCNALAFPERDVIIIDIAFISSISMGMNCEEGREFPRTWFEDPTSMVASASRLFGSDWRSFFASDPLKVWEMYSEDLVELDYRGRAIMPVLVVGHELSHLYLHKESNIPISRNIGGKREVEMSLEREESADNFAIEALISSLTIGEITSFDGSIKQANGYQLGVFDTSIPVSEKLRVFTLLMSGYSLESIISDTALVDENGETLRTNSEELQEVKLGCDDSLIYARRIMGLASSLVHYSWRLRVVAAESGDERFHADEKEDQFYIKIKNDITNKIRECGLYDFH